MSDKPQGRKPRAGKSRCCRWLWGFDGRLRPDSVRAGWRKLVAAGSGGGSAELGGDFHVARPRLGRVAGRGIVLWTYTVVAGREPAVRAIVLAGVDLRDCCVCLAKVHCFPRFKSGPANSRSSRKHSGYPTTIMVSG